MKAGLGSTLYKTVNGHLVASSYSHGWKSQIVRAKFSGRSMRVSLIGKQKASRFLICKIDDGISFKPHHPILNCKVEALLGINLTENSRRLMQHWICNSRRDGEQVLLESLLTELHPNMFNTSSFGEKIDGSTRANFLQFRKFTFLRFGEPDIFGHSIRRSEPLRSRISKPGKSWNNQYIQQVN